MEKSKILYDKLHLIMMFLNKLPEMFILALPQMKREIIQTCCRTLSYDGKTLYIEQFPLFNEMKKWKKDIYGAGDVLFLEPTKQLLNEVKSEEYQYIEYNLSELAA